MGALTKTERAFRRLPRARGGFDYLHAAPSGTKYQDLVAAVLSSHNPVRTAADTVLNLAREKDPQGALYFIQLVTRYHVGMIGEAHETNMALVVQATNFVKGRFGR